jgi:hypothetical protein
MLTLVVGMFAADAVHGHASVAMAPAALKQDALQACHLQPVIVAEFATNASAFNGTTHT